MFGIGGGRGTGGGDGTDKGRPSNLPRRLPSLRVIGTDAAKDGEAEKPKDMAKEPGKDAPRVEPPSGRSGITDHVLSQLIDAARQEFSTAARRAAPRGEKARLMGELVARQLAASGVQLNALELRDMVRLLLEEIAKPIPEPAPDANADASRAGNVHRIEPGAGTQPAATPTGAKPAKPAMTGKGMLLDESGEAQLFYSVYAQSPSGAIDYKSAEAARDRIHPLVMDRIELSHATRLPRPELERQLTELVADLLAEQHLQINHAEQTHLVTMLVDDMLGLGPLEPLLADESITDIMVNGPHQVYIERKGKLHVTDVRFRDDEHVMNVAKRIVSRVGRRIDEASPLVDARLMDGSRVNVIVPPLAIDGPSISIRKFSKIKLSLDRMVEQGNISAEMARVLQIAARCRLNILISGGTGSGKTTLLNAMSRMIDHGERIVTIEDAAELQLQQPHVVRLETRPASLEGAGEIIQRDLVKNALRMRPDRIILGEVRGSEALDMLQAMNTGHDGSMCTVHANRPREALTRLENMVNMAGSNLPARTIRQQIAAAVNVVVQIARMRDGVRRITSIMELVGMEGDVITAQELFTYEFEREGENGELIGSFKSHGIRPHFLPKAGFFGLEKELMEVI
jgi:pilus assembly protein CpaF